MLAPKGRFFALSQKARLVRFTIRFLSPFGDLLGIGLPSSTSLGVFLPSSVNTFSVLLDFCGVASPHESTKAMTLPSPFVFSFQRAGGPGYSSV